MIEPEMCCAWERRFPGAHGLDIVMRNGEEQYWITDHTRRVVSVCSAEGVELRRIEADALASRYPDLSRYRPTGTAKMADGDFYIADGYGSSFVHHFDPVGRYMGSFGGEGDAPENLMIPHSVWIDSRSGKPQLLVCDRGHNTIKWFSSEGQWLRTLNLGDLMDDNEPTGVLPCNVAPLSSRWKNHLAVACFFGVVLILDGQDHVVSVVGCAPPHLIDSQISRIELRNYTFGNLHDIHADSDGALYVSQWGPNRTYPMKLDLL